MLLQVHQAAAYRPPLLPSPTVSATLPLTHHAFSLPSSSLVLVFCSRLLILCRRAQASPPADRLSLDEGVEGAGFAKTPSPGAEASAAGAHFNREKMCWEVREERRGEGKYEKGGNFGWMREGKRGR